MRTYTSDEIESMEFGISQMIEGYKETKLADLNQDNLIELETLYNDIVGTFKDAQGECYTPIDMPLIDDLSVNRLDEILTTLIEASKGLLIIAKSRQIA